MRNRHITRFGDPTSRRGALYCVSDQEGFVQMAVDLEASRAAFYGDDPTPQFIENTAARVLQLKSTYNAIVSAAGVPSPIRGILSSTRKAEASKLAKNLTIHEFDLFLLFHNAAQLGLQHSATFPEYVPDHLVITDGDRDLLKSGNVRPFSKKTRGIFLERRHIHVHLLRGDEAWHCIYFSYDDIEPAGSNHWKYGAHLHYVSHLWPSLSAEAVWNAFKQRKTQIPGVLHVRLIPFEYSAAHQLAFPILNDSFSSEPGAFAFSPGLALKRTGEPAPPAAIATRGLWTASVSLPRRF